MNTFNRSLFVLTLSLALVSGYSQNANSQKADKKTQSDEPREETRSDGLKKIVSRSSHHWDRDIDIDEKVLERNIEIAIETSMKSLEVALEKMEINMKSMEINLGNIKPINIPQINIDIPPINVDIPPINIDLDHHININTEKFHHRFDREEDDRIIYKNHSTLPGDKDNNKTRSKQKDKSDNQDKAKGLRKLN